jgi:hypothetical protein
MHAYYVFSFSSSTNCRILGVKKSDPHAKLVGKFQQYDVHEYRLEGHKE